ncbi:MAG: hypothetical protein QW059_05065 [Nitrososphaerota archaeon]
MTTGELVFIAILAVTIAALAGLWLSTRAPKSQEPPPDVYIQPPYHPPEPMRPRRRETANSTATQRPQSRAQTQRQPEAGARARSEKPPVEAGGGGEGGGPGEAGGSADQAQSPQLRVDVDEARQMLEDTLRLYNELLEEMGRLKKQLSERLH